MKIYSKLVLKFKLPIYACVLLSSLLNVCRAQGVPLEEIKTVTRDSSHKYFYPRLLDEFNAQPEYYSMEKGMYLYYGQLYSSSYKFFNFGKNAMQFEQFINRGQLKKAIKIGEQILLENPVNLNVLYKLAYCYNKESQPEKADIAKNKAVELLRAIESSGSGMNREQAFKVTSVNDEYILAGKLGIKKKIRKSEMLAHSVVDSWELKDPDSGVIKYLYFEVLYNYDAVRLPEDDKK
ncbi:DUF4919 domain-containing protein [Dyadobacter subterraneus]|uniref:DUF4919 domain-containing protein n=1 Tax=Dyadobacter subterraneus TaxID=2773304 RepID=A0ABR9WEN0_9BACT|nr:DUF4919 domain-containing protein [Dyadobacter subterraneus]MBE9463584.1 DUF4919 domain-containing protein [Dyadobacter subterraneus]